MIKITLHFYIHQELEEIREIIPQVLITKIPSNT